MNTKNIIKIFIVEDSNVFTQALKIDIEKVFENKHIQIHTFETGEKCIKKFKEIKPQIVILDYNLNSKSCDAADGITVLKWLKKERKETYVIMLTNEDNINIAYTSFLQGSSDYIVKTESKFHKINNSLLNLFRLMESKKLVKQHRQLLFGVCIFFVLVICLFIAIKIFNPEFYE